ncbi:MAG: hypothetical protein AAGE96_21565 [Cyanobacteria bacterium P01_G01_bin.19]
MKLLPIILVSVLGLTVLTEIGLRLTKGLGNPPLYVADNNIGYLLTPNQKMRRFGNRIEVNQYSIRDGEVEKEKKPGIERVFLVGDSVVFGSWWTD